MGRQPTTTQPVHSLQQFIESLVDKHEVDLCQAGVSLTLNRPGQPDAWLLYHAGLAHVVLAHLIHEPGGQPLPEAEFLFFTGDAAGWQPVEIRYSLAAWAVYMNAAGMQVDRSDSTTNGKAMFNGFVAYWVGRLVTEAWLTAGQVTIRLSGCQSTNHIQCYGELWWCAACHRTFCWAEGTDNHPELCDDCWAARFAPETVADTPRVSFTEGGSLDLVCDCPEGCGAWLELTPDGILALEDKDGLRVSLLLPAWLEDAIRQATLIQQVAAQKDHEALND